MNQFVIIMFLVQSFRRDLAKKITSEEITKDLRKTQKSQSLFIRRQTNDKFQPVNSFQSVKPKNKIQIS